MNSNCLFKLKLRTKYFFVISSFLLPGTEVEIGVLRERSILPRPASRAETSLAKNGAKFVRVSAAARALGRAAAAFSAASDAHAARCRRVLLLMARRLAGTVDFMEHLFALEGSGALDFSAMSLSMRDQMRR